MRFKVSELEASQDEVRGFREAQTRFEIEISQLQNSLTDANFYKEQYDLKQRECDDLQRQFYDEQRKVDEKENEINALRDRLSDESLVQSELRESITEHLETIRDLKEQLERPVENESSSEESEWKQKYDELNV